MKRGGTFRLGTMTEIWHFLNSIGAILGVGAIGVVLLMIFAPSFVGVIAEYLKAMSPLLRGIANGVVWFFRTMWEGFKDMTDNAASIIFVVVMIILSGWYFHTPQQPAPRATGNYQKLVAPEVKKSKSILNFKTWKEKARKIAPTPRREKPTPTPGELMNQSW